MSIATCEFDSHPAHRNEDNRPVVLVLFSTLCPDLFVGRDGGLTGQEFTIKFRVRKVRFRTRSELKTASWVSNHLIFTRKEVLIDQ